MTTPLTDSSFRPCLSCAAPAGGYLDHKLRGIDDVEGARVPDGLPPVVDAHVHLFPTPMFRALWRWFDEWAWPVRYPLDADGVIAFLRDRGIHRIVGLHYAHKPGMAEGLNEFMADLVARHPGVTGTATVLPGEPDAVGILERAFAKGLRGVKLHCHVQCFAPDDEELHDVYACCARHDAPLVMHAGREPKSPGYACDPHALCAAERLGRVLEDYPGLKVCVPHLGMDEIGEYVQLLERHDNLWLDTTMVLAGFFPDAVPWDLLARRPERLLYGTDFPNIPFAWDRELSRILERELPPDALEKLLGGTAVELHGL
ncbi:MAG: amidohydrolase family protein [Polyangiaceae bacterium]